jgi:predicted Zn finger-like uncharacterized protein
MINFKCPQCQTSYQVKDEFGGRTTKCAKCKFQITLPFARQETFVAVQPVAPPPRPSPPPPPSQKDLRDITRMIPPETRNLMRKGETALHFTFIAMAGGCQQIGAMQGPPDEEEWLLVTDQRVMYQANTKVKDGSVEKFINRSGSIPLVKISYTGISSGRNTDGCNYTSFAELEVSSGGGTVSIVMPTKRDAIEAKRVIDDLISGNDE